MPKEKTWGIRYSKFGSSGWSSWGYKTKEEAQKICDSHDGRFDSCYLTVMEGGPKVYHKWVKITNKLHRCSKCRELRIQTEFSTYYINVKNDEKRKTSGNCKGGN